ncbi:FecR family protein [Sphingomonas sp. OTU376]|uniref:FecR family protein n=1 Tax=Sphingomonas sp. OTU376 TaxID=3043863 RepID=UPI00313C6AE5
MNDEERAAVAARKALEDKAAWWFGKMHAPDAQAWKGDFDAWLAESDDHRAAYDRLEAADREASILKQSTRFDADLQPTASWKSPRRKWVYVAVAAAAAIAFAVVIRPATLPSTYPAGQQFASSAPGLSTGHGEIRSYRLPDGSNLTLDSDSRVELAIGGKERRVHLREGKARFEVQPDPRPFVVEAGAGSVTASRAVFDVGYAGDRQIEINLYSGSADLGPATEPAVYTAPSRLLRAGQPLRYQAADFRPEPAPAASADRKDWPSGWVEYRSVALGDLVGEANRYATQPIILDDLETGRLAASGRFKLTDTDTFVSRLAELLNLSVLHKPDGIHLRRE